MIAYFDTSALVPLLVDESTSATCGDLWDFADRVVCTRLGYIEAVAAVAMAERIGRITELDGRAGLAVLEHLWSEIVIVELNRQLMTHAATLATRHCLRGYDATHCAAAVGINDVDLVAASGDKRLLAAWRAEGVSVRDTRA